MIQFDIRTAGTRIEIYTYVFFINHISTELSDFFWSHGNMTKKFYAQSANDGRNKRQFGFTSSRDRGRMEIGIAENTTDDSHKTAFE